MDGDAGGHPQIQGRRVYDAAKVDDHIGRLASELAELEGELSLLRAELGSARELAGGVEEAEGLLGRALLRGQRAADDALAEARHAAAAVVSNAEREAAELVTQARLDAGHMRDLARSEAEAIIEGARRDVERTTRRYDEALAEEVAASRKRIDEAFARHRSPELAVPTADGVSQSGRVVQIGPAPLAGDAPAGVRCDDAPRGPDVAPSTCVPPPEAAVMPGPLGWPTDDGLDEAPLPGGSESSAVALTAGTCSGAELAVVGVRDRGSRIWLMGPLWRLGRGRAPWSTRRRRASLGERCERTAIAASLISGASSIRARKSAAPRAVGVLRRSALPLEGWGRTGARRAAQGYSILWSSSGAGNSRGPKRTPRTPPGAKVPELAPERGDPVLAPPSRPSRSDRASGASGTTCGRFRHRQDGAVWFRTPSARRGRAAHQG